LAFLFIKFNYFLKSHFFHSSFSSLIFKKKHYDNLFNFRLNFWDLNFTPREAVGCRCLRDNLNNLKKGKGMRESKDIAKTT